MKTPITKETITQIVKNNFYDINTIEIQNSDHLDFHDVAIWEIKQAIIDAYNTGYQQAINDKKRKPKNK